MPPVWRSLTRALRRRLPTKEVFWRAHSPETAAQQAPGAGAVAHTRCGIERVRCVQMSQRATVSASAMLAARDSACQLVCRTRAVHSIEGPACAAGENYHTEARNECWGTARAQCPCGKRLSTDYQCSELTFAARLPISQLGVQASR
jgi:hypothetical protein